MPAPERTLSQWIDYAHSLGLAITNLSQLPDGKWRLSMVVFGATPELARDPEYTDFADRETPEECFTAVFASQKHRAAWEPKAALAVAAMADPASCTATLILADRWAVNAARAAFLAGKRVERQAQAAIKREDTPVDDVEARRAERQRRLLG